MVASNIASNGARSIHMIITTTATATSTPAVATSTTAFSAALSSRAQAPARLGSRTVLRTPPGLVTSAANVPLS